MPDLPTFANGGVLPLIAVLLVLFVMIALLATRRPPKAPPWVCHAGHLHTSQRGMDLCDATEHEWPGVA